MADAHDHGFSANKILLGLVVLTTIEVAWSFLDFPRWAVWGGLLIFAFWKGFLIFTYFMHMKFEGWIVKGFLAPVIPLIAIVLFAVMPDVAFNSQAKYPIGSKLDPKTGEVSVLMHEHDDDEPAAHQEAAAAEH